MRLTTSLPRMLLPFALGLLCTLDARAAANDDDFNRDAAMESLSSVDVGHCKTKKGPTGEGHVVVTFAPTGSARGAVVDKGPFVGTKAGKCIVKAYKKAKVPPFKGDPVNVGKKFTID